MTNRLEQGVAQYQQQRNALLAALQAYRAWLDRHANAEAQQTLHLYDLEESLRQDKLTLAFVAEFSRGKSELINALFFADLKQRLLPSDVGRTTMCPTEIFYDAETHPYLRLLPIESRLRDDSLATLKRMPIEWSGIRLEPDNPTQMATAFRALAEVKRVPLAVARALGLHDDNAPQAGSNTPADGMVEVPAWRYALINFPHPLLKSGLSILDTPGLNALGNEPELTLNAIPSAHAVLFLLATDTGVTRSDLDIWEKNVYRRVHHHIAVLNKIDMLWDDLKSDSEIETALQKQVFQTAQLLKLPRHQVLAISAQKALVAKVRGDAALLARSNIGALESMLADHIIPSRQRLLHESVNLEVLTMLEASHHGVQTKISGLRDDVQQLSAFTGKNREIITKLRDKLVLEKRGYDAAALNFKITRTLVQTHGRSLLSALSPDVLDTMLNKSRAHLDESWTTASLTRGMQTLFDRINTQFGRVDVLASDILSLLEAAYLRFQEQHDFPALNPPVLSLDRYRQRLADLARSTDVFCHDPLNLMLEKRFMINKFYQSLVSEARDTFDMARTETDAWLRRTLDPLVVRIRDHKNQLELRVENIKKVHGNLDGLQERIAELNQQHDAMQIQQTEINALLQTLSKQHYVTPVHHALPNNTVPKVQAVA
jgi:predicted GTPase